MFADALAPRRDVSRGGSFSLIPEHVMLRRVVVMDDVNSFTIRHRQHQTHILSKIEINERVLSVFFISLLFFSDVNSILFQRRYPVCLDRRFRYNTSELPDLQCQKD